MLQHLIWAGHRQSNSFGRSILQMLPSGGTTELKRYHRDYLSVDDRKWMYDLDQQARRIFLLAQGYGHPAKLDA
jgi:hypothetical protein